MYYCPSPTHTHTQQAHAVDVVESREATPISSGGGVIPESVSEELESLSRASRQFLQVWGVCVCVCVWVDVEA